MAAGSETLIAGQYSVTWNSVAMGIMEGDQSVPTIEAQAESEPVASTDKYGRMNVDDVYLGANAFAQFVCYEYRAGTKACWWPWGSSMWLTGVVARLGYSLSQALVLTAIAGTPAAASPATLTASKSLLAFGYNTKLLYGPTIRKVPIRLRLYLYDTAGGALGYAVET